MQEKSVGSPATAKNVISVGASMSNNAAYEGTGCSPPFFDKNKHLFNENDMAYFSSIGPTGNMIIDSLFSSSCFEVAIIYGHQYELQMMVASNLMLWRLVSVSGLRITVAAHVRNQ